MKLKGWFLTYFINSQSCQGRKKHFLTTENVFNPPQNCRPLPGNKNGDAFCCYTLLENDYRALENEFPPPENCFQLKENENAEVFCRSLLGEYDFPQPGKEKGEGKNDFPVNFRRNCVKGYFNRFENRPVLSLIPIGSRPIFSFHPLGFGVKKTENFQKRGRLRQQVNGSCKSKGIKVAGNKFMPLLRCIIF